MKTGQKIVAVLMVLSFVFALVSAAIAADDPKIHQMTLIFSGKQRYGKGIDKSYAEAEFIKNFFGLTIENLSGSKFRVNTLYYPYTNKIKKYKDKYYFDVETFCKFFGIKYEKVNETTFHVLDSTIPMFNQFEVKGPTEMNFKVGKAKMKINTCSVKERDFLSLEDLKITPDDSQKESMGILKANNKIIYRWLDKDGKTFAYIKDINLVLPPTQKIVKVK